MTARCSPFRFLLPALFAVSLAGVAAADKGVDVAAASAPAGTDARVKQALSESIRLHAGQAGLTDKLRGYSISPALIQLRGFVDPGQKRARTVCVVELALHDAERGLVASIRGNASSVGATPLAVVDAAAHAAVDRLPETLAALQAPEQGRARVAGR
jgi:hypothetical protein